MTCIASLEASSSANPSRELMPTTTSPPAPAAAASPADPDDRDLRVDGVFEQAADDLVHVVPGYHRSNSDYPATCRGRPEGDPLGERSASHPFCSGPIPFSLPFRFGVPSFRPSSRPAASPRDDSVLLSVRDRDHFAGRLVDFLLVVLDLLDPFPREPFLDASHDGMFPIQEVAVRDEAVDEVEVVPRNVDRDSIPALTDGLDIRLDRLEDQL